MTNLNVDRTFATAAAIEFTRQNRSYIANQRNSELMGKELARLVLQEDADPHALETYRQAFSNLYEALELREPDEPKPFDALTDEKLFALSPEEKDQLPTPILKRLAAYELQRGRQKQMPSQEEMILTELFEEQGFADSNANKAQVHSWLATKNLEFSPSNILAGILACESGLAPSEKALEEMSSEEYRRAVVDPEFRKRQAAQPKREIRQPLGVNYTTWLHNS